MKVKKLFKHMVKDCYIYVYDSTNLTLYHGIYDAMPKALLDMHVKEFYIRYYASKNSIIINVKESFTYQEIKELKQCEQS